MIVRGPRGRRYIYGWRDPFMWGGFGPSWGYNDVESFTVYTSDLNLQISRAADGYRLFEGHAQAQSRDNDLTQIVPNLVEAMFTNFPGNSGERVRITLASGKQVNTEKFGRAGAHHRGAARKEVSAKGVSAKARLRTEGGLFRARAIDRAPPPRSRRARFRGERRRRLRPKPKADGGGRVRRSQRP